MLMGQLRLLILTRTSTDLMSLSTQALTNMTVHREALSWLLFTPQETKHTPLTLALLILLRLGNTLIQLEMPLHLAPRDQVQITP